MFSMTNQIPISCPFTVVIDTREQAPYSFQGLEANADHGRAPLVVHCERATLPTGDYSIRGMERYIVVERKSLSDAYGTFIGDRERWERELDRMMKIPSCHVVIEAGWDEIAAGPVKVDGAKIGKAVMRSIFAWTIRFPHVHWWAAPSREWGETMTFRILEKFWEADQWQLKQLGKLSIESESPKKRRRSQGKCTSETS